MLSAFFDLIGAIQKTAKRECFLKIIIIRHGDPDYEHDTLTQKGVKEAELLTKRTVNMGIDEIWCSPLGRAKATADGTIKALGKTPRIESWLREFDALVPQPETGNLSYAWDFRPRIYQNDDLIYSDRWMESPLYNTEDFKTKYEQLCRGIDEMLAAHGYKKEGRIFTTEKGNDDTLALFCHFGVEGFILSYLFSTSPHFFHQNFVALPTSVTTIYTEEREEGIVAFRCCGYGDISHLYAGNEPPSFSARFCEKFDSPDRHD